MLFVNAVSRNRDFSRQQDGYVGDVLEQGVNLMAEEVSTLET